jgi:hypothetical protein
VHSWVCVLTKSLDNDSLGPLAITGWDKESCVQFWQSWRHLEFDSAKLGYLKKENKPENVRGA